jgi:hypothetical protein
MDDEEGPCMVPKQKKGYFDTCRPAVTIYAPRFVYIIKY